MHSMIFYSTFFLCIFLIWLCSSEQGAVGLRMRVYDRVMCFVNCHFAAHLEAVSRRNADFDHVYQTMVFSRPSNLFNPAAGMVRYLLLCCLLACSMYLLPLVYSSCLPLVLSVAAGVSSTIHMLRSTNVRIYFNWYCYYLVCRFHHDSFHFLFHNNVSLIKFHGLD